MTTSERGKMLEREFAEQLDAYYASPRSSFYDSRIEKRFLEQKLNHLGFTPYPKDGLITFGASGTHKCDREIFFRNTSAKKEKSNDIPFRGRQRSIGTATIDYRQLDLVSMPKVLGGVKFEMLTTRNGEWAMEDAAQVRKVFDIDGVKFAIVAKPDGIFTYKPDGSRLIFEFKTKATGLNEMNKKLDFSGAQTDHLRQVTAESILFGINEGFILYESMQKPSWFSDEEKSSIAKYRKTWKHSQPISDIRPFYFNIIEDQQNELLSDLARQASIVYSGKVPEITVDMTQKCGFCPFKDHCKSVLTDAEKEMLREIENRMQHSSMDGKQEHRELIEYLKDVM